MKEKEEFEEKDQEEEAVCGRVAVHSSIEQNYGHHREYFRNDYQRREQDKEIF